MDELTMTLLCMDEMTSQSVSKLEGHTCIQRCKMEFHAVL
jgi:hypothetical protein